MNNSAPPTSASANANPPPPPPPRPIRFVTNHDGPYAKRRRINSACLTCRKKKTRCSASSAPSTDHKYPGERPVCGTCITNKHQCAGYGENENAQDTSKDAKKVAPSSTTAPAPAPKIKQEVTSQLSQPQPQSPPPPLSSRPSHHRTKSSSIETISNTPHNSENSYANQNTNGKRKAMDQDIADPGGPLTLSTRNRMPYFRYFGPTAIMPGFKQMVVKVRGKRHGTGHTTTSDPLESSPTQPPSLGSPPETQTPAEIPVYDTSAMAPSPLITHLCKLFFVHLGCNFPFLQRERFLRDLEEKQVDAILVDAVCALAARFSTHSFFTGDSEHREKPRAKLQPSEYGQAFAQRAKSAIPDTFPCPSVAVVQAALLLAYDEFGANRDSGLWMYLGLAIRMAQDLGMQTLEGLKYEGRDGPVPKLVKTEPGAQRHAVRAASKSSVRPRTSGNPDEVEQRAVERERLDTFWVIYLLDRIISSGTGRPVTLRDQDIEISFPSLDEVDPTSGWPLPFPALIRIVHLYGRVTDLLNSIKESSDLTEDLRKQLDSLENSLTEIYQNLSPKLHFNALNFQHYVKLNQGTNFLLLHCWFHTLIVLLHQPTLLKTYAGSAQPLSNNSRELSMSSAKTVADILAFTDLIDAKTGVGNPFTSQPIYIAACAFLQETALHSASSQPHTQPPSPGAGVSQGTASSGSISIDHMTFPRSSHSERANDASEREQKQAAKHTLLATAANQNYQRCYRALKTLETYWAGVKYILTVLEQKAKGVGDPLLYTREEMESALEAPRPEPSFTSPGWRRKLSWGTYLTAQDMTDVDTAKLSAAIRKGAKTPIPGSPMNPSQAIGWSLTGTMNSPSTNVAVMYPSDNNNNTRDSKASFTKVPVTADRSPATPAPSNPPALSSQNTYLAFDPINMPPPLPAQSLSAISTQPDPVLASQADLLLSLHSPFSTSSPSSARQPLQPTSFLRGSPLSNQTPTQPNEFTADMGTYPTPTDNMFGDMVIDSQEVDMSIIGAEMMPWDLEYLPSDMFYFGGGSYEGGNVDENTGAGATEG
ncbi:hypothetical protein DM02DRAFT_627850 [Periconia macrospinosa]|uniref:Zn(2)-C6 fungal-type domain-containing protein n=1 Tax=Periconia macrospinosa TaxID=97972 RepID=A0A2V1DWJ2_9PLEO|nr:hypothetical protein DM02DRAFT_627850 [Periconia macrospinosa]